MTVRVEWSTTGTVRTFKDLSQREANKLITDISKMQESRGEVPVKIVVW